MIPPVEIRPRGETEITQDPESDTYGLVVWLGTRDYSEALRESAQLIQTITTNAVREGGSSDGPPRA